MTSANAFNITLTDAAVARLKEITRSNPSHKNYGTTLMVSVRPGGCSGMKYKYEFIKKPGETDIRVVSKCGEICVVLDDFSAAVLKGSEIDYVDLMESGVSAFQIKNPNATTGCGCGKSFGI